MQKLTNNAGFMGGLTDGLRKYGDPQKVLNFATAAACLKQNIPGDFYAVSTAEVEARMADDVPGGVSR